MNSTPNAKDALIARADEQLTSAYEQIARADEQLAHVTEQFSKIERDAARDPSVGTGPQPPRGRPARRGLIGLLLAVCIVSIVVAAFVSQSSRSGVKLIGVQWAPQLISTPSLPLKNSPFPAQPDPSSIQVTAAEAAPPQAAPLAHTRPQDAATAAAAASELAQLLQKMTGDLATLEQRMEQLKAKQDQIANDNPRWCSTFVKINALMSSFRELALGRRAERRTPMSSLQAIVVQWVTPGALLLCSVWVVRRSQRTYRGPANRFYRSPPNRLPEGRDPFAGPRSPRSSCRESFMA